MIGRLLSADEAHPLIACIYASGEAQQRMALADLSEPEKADARALAANGFNLIEAAKIVRRSRRARP